MYEIAWILSALALVVSSLGVHDDGQRLWPKVRAMSRTIHFSDRSAQRANLKIVAMDGKPLYLLECCLNAYDYADSEFDYSGAFECRMTSLYLKDTHSTLLTETEHQSRDWESRGRFLLSLIEGACANFPDYGRTRNFRLRGMKLILKIDSFLIDHNSHISNAPWFVDRIKELDLSISVVSDPEASSVIAEPTEYLEPPYRHPENPKDLSRNCDKVLKKKKQ